MVHLMDHVRARIRPYVSNSARQLVRKYSLTKLYVRITQKYRELFNTSRLPDFFIIGAQKGGTTALYSYLVQHPGILAATRKEIHYFDNPENRAKGKSWYASHFCSKSYENKLAGKLGYMPITGEATPDMNMPLNPKFVHELLPDVKLIALLRNPVDRAFSQYHLNQRILRETLSFEEAISQSATSVSRERAENEQLYRNSPLRSYITRGLYAEQLERWYQYYPKERLYIICSESYFENSNPELKKVLEFLSLPDFEFDTATVSLHKGNYKEKMKAETREYLTEFFRPHNRKLFQLIGRDFGWPS